MLGEANLKRVKNLDEWGLFQVIDGSLFPTLLQMRWSEYRKAKNAFKLHLSFELNRMMATEFVVGSGKSAERVFLAGILEKGITYIADRGYAGFEIIAKLLEREAYFIFRVKENWLFEVRETLEIAASEMPQCFKQMTDELIIFKNDRQQNQVRLIGFEVGQSRFRLITNRQDLTTLQVIILYAYRWQIELFFKYVKRTLNRLHLFNHSENGVGIQFYLLMTLAILLLKFKQECDGSKKPKREKSVEKNEEKEPHPSEWIRKITKIFYDGWKISKKWLLIIRNSLNKVIDNELLTLLNSC